MFCPAFVSLRLSWLLILQTPVTKHSEATPELVINFITEALRLTHFIRLIRGVILRAASLQELALELAVLGGFIIVLISIAILRFSKRLD